MNNNTEQNQCQELKNNNYSPQYHVHVIVDDLGLTPNEYRLYGHYLRRSGHMHNNIFESLETTCKAIGLSAPTARSARKGLCDKGLIKITRPRRHDGGDSTILIEIVDLHYINKQYTSKAITLEQAKNKLSSGEYLKTLEAMEEGGGKNLSGGGKNSFPKESLNIRYIESNTQEESIIMQEENFVAEATKSSEEEMNPQQIALAKKMAEKEQQPHVSLTADESQSIEKLKKIILSHTNSKQLKKEVLEAINNDVKYYNVLLVGKVKTAEETFSLDSIVKLWKNDNYYRRWVIEDCIPSILKAMAYASQQGRPFRLSQMRLVKAMQDLSKFRAWQKAKMADEGVSMTETPSVNLSNPLDAFLNGRFMNELDDDERQKAEYIMYCIRENLPIELG